VQTSNAISMRIMRQGSKCITDESFSNLNPDKNDHQRRIVVQGNGDHDFALMDHTLKRWLC
jgi:hypothetical protein